MPNYSHGTKLSLASVEEPPYLNVGTDVSAKYKGAFCEAKIIDVDKHVKLRVLFDGSNGSYLIDDSDLKSGSALETGSRIEAKHPEKKNQTYIQAIITKILDQSRYTVVFDDGDQCILRRNSLCLKSGKHFAESETLDQLPLTNPEHFGNPVKVGAFEQQNNSQQASTNTKNNNNNNNSSDNSHSTNPVQVSSIASNRLQNNIKHQEAEKQSRSKTSTGTTTGAKRGPKGRKRRESVNNGSKHAQDFDDDSVDSCVDSAEAESIDSNVRYDLIDIGVKLMIQYGKGKVQNVYEAKVNKIETTASGKVRYFVHYTGWNNRYDEWVTRNRVVSIVTEKENGARDGRSRQPDSNSMPTTSNSNTPPTTSASHVSISSNNSIKEKDVPSKTRRSRQSEVIATTTTTDAPPASSSSQSPELQESTHSIISTSKSEAVASPATASRPAASSARHHRQRGESSAVILSQPATTAASTTSATSLSVPSPSTIPLTTQTTTATTITTTNSTLSAAPATTNNTTKSQRTTQNQQPIASNNSVTEVQEQSTIVRQSTGRRGRGSLAEKLSLADTPVRTGEKPTNSVGRRGGNHVSARGVGRPSLASTVAQSDQTITSSDEQQHPQQQQLPGRRVKCLDCGGRCRCRSRRQLLSPKSVASARPCESSPPSSSTQQQQQQMSSKSHKSSSPISPTSPNASSVDTRDESNIAVSVDKKLEIRSCPSPTEPNGSKVAQINRPLASVKAESSSIATNERSEEYKVLAEPMKDLHSAALATAATSTRDNLDASNSITHSTSGSSVTTTAATLGTSDSITTNAGDNSSNCDSIGMGGSSGSSGSSRSEMNERRASTSTAASNNIESISATSASNISATSSTRRLYSFCDEIDEPDCDKKISILQERIMALRQTYISLKTELTDLDRRRKRPRTERSNSEHVSCGVSCRN